MPIRFDIVLVNAGSSAGREDFTCDVIEALGKVCVYEVYIKPGKSVILEIYSVAKLLGLDFIKLGNENYDFAVSKECMDMIKEFIKVIKSDEFKKELDTLGGYDYTDIGKIIEL